MSGDFFRTHFAVRRSVTARVAVAISDRGNSETAWKLSPLAAAAEDSAKQAASDLPPE